MLALNERPDQRTIEASVESLKEAGVEPDLIGKLQEVYPPSVVAMAKLRSWAKAEAKGQLPIGGDDISTTEEQIMASFVEVYVADNLQQREIDAEFGCVGVVVEVRHDWNDHRTDIEVRTNGTSHCGGSNGHRPMSATLTILQMFSLSDESFGSFVRKRLKCPVEGSTGRQRINEVKEDAAMKAGKITKAAVGTA